MKTHTFKMNTSALILGICLFVSPAFAQSDEVGMIQELWGMEKKALIDDYMAFSATEADAFWPIYDDYMAAKQELSRNRIKLIMDYADNLGTLTSDKASELTMGVLNNDVKMNKLQKKYFKKMGKAITPLRAAEFLQVERYLDTTIRSEFQEAIPFIGEINALKQ